MFNVGEYVVYKREVCIIKEIKIGKNDIEYYILIPVSDDTLKIDIPVDFASKTVKKLIDRKGAIDLIEKIPEIDVLNLDTKLLEVEYKKLLSDETHESLIKIIKTTYLRNKERIDTKRKVSDKDYYYFTLAEKYLYNELSVVLDKSYNDTKEFIINEVEKIVNMSK